jgi:hypothetical protein
MEHNNLVHIAHFCANCDIEYAFIQSLNSVGIIDIIIMDNHKYFSTDRLKDVERAVRIHHELDVNLEGIDVIFNLTKQINVLQNELKVANYRLKIKELH